MIYFKSIITETLFIYPVHSTSDIDKILYEQGNQKRNFVCKDLL